MFTNIVLVILCLYAVISPLIFIYCIKMGVRLGTDPNKESVTPIMKRKPKKPEMSEEEKTMKADLEAINGFDGF